MNSFHWSFLFPPFWRVLHAKKRHRSIFCMGCLADLRQNSRCYLVFLNVYQTETNVSLAEMWCLGLRNPPCPALLAFGPEQKVCAVYGLHKSTFMVILALYVVVVNIFRIYIVFQIKYLLSSSIKHSTENPSYKLLSYS